MVAPESVQYVYIRSGAEPAVMSVLVISTVFGEQTAGGSVINTVGIPGVAMVTEFDSVEVQPVEFVTLNVKTPPGRFDIVLLVPVPAVVTAPGNRVITHDPDGNPFSTTLPEGIVSVGWVIIPITGAAGMAGGTGIITFNDGPDKQPSAVVTVKLKVPGMRPAIVVLVPVPVVLIVPGYRIIVQLPVAGNPVRTTLPVGNAHVRAVIVPTIGAGGIDG
jgi:hypothetical protein